MFTLSSMKIGMKYQDVRNEIIKSKNLIMRCLPASCNSNYNVVEQKDGTTGDVYDNFKDFKREHPFSPYKFGYVVFDTEYGYIPDSCNDWNDSPEEAMFDYEENCE